MKKTGGDRFVYVIYIRTTPEKLWSALTTPDFVRRYWLGITPQADWKKGGAWKLVRPDGGVADDGKIVEFDPPRRLAIRWRHRLDPKLEAEGLSLCTMELEPAGKAVRLTVTHSIERTKSKFISAVSHGWPAILSNLKSLMETGKVALPNRY